MNSILKTGLNEIVDLTKVGTLEVGNPHFNDVRLRAQEELDARTVIPSARNNGKKRLLLFIDPQNDFIIPSPIGTLSVPGAVEDTKRSIEFIYNNFQHIDRIAFSKDWHRYSQIFFPFNYRDKNGKRPDFMTEVSPKMLVDGDLTFIADPKKLPKGCSTGQDVAIKYTKHLEDNGLTPLTLWPYHCITDTPGASTEFQLAKMIDFHGYVRQASPYIIQKGTHPYSEMYGIFMTEDRTFIDTNALMLFEIYDEIIFAGQAKTHCLLSSILQAIEYYEQQGRPEIIKKITVIEDLTSPIPIPSIVAATEKKFAEFKGRGMNIIKSTDYIAT